MQSSVINNDKCQWLTSTRYSECSTSKYTNGTIEFVYAPLLDQVIHSALLEWSLSEPSAAASLAEWGHVNHLTVTKASKEPGPWFTLLKWLILLKFLKNWPFNRNSVDYCWKIIFLHQKVTFKLQFMRYVYTLYVVGSILYAIYKILQYFTYLMTFSNITFS